MPDTAVKVQIDLYLETAGRRQGYYAARIRNGERQGANLLTGQYVTSREEAKRRVGRVLARRYFGQQVVVEWVGEGAVKGAGA